MSEGTSKAVKDAINIWAESTPSDFEENARRYRETLFKKLVFILVCIVIAIMAMGVSMTIGEYNISFLESYETLWNHITGNIQDSTKDRVIWGIRMPRVMGGLIAGAGLAVAGVAMQSILKNPLADTYTTGISSGASLGATLAICSGITLFAGTYSLILNAFIFSLIPTSMILMISKMKGVSPTVVILGGVAVMYFFNAITTVLKLWAEAESLAQVYSWSVGSLTGLGWPDIAVMAIFVVSGTLLIQIMSKKLNVLATGDESAKALGIDASTMRSLCLGATALMAAAIVCFTGLIGFIGLVCPHVARMFVGSDNRYLIPASAMFGAAFLLFADVVGRMVFAPAVMEVGVITAFIGGPMFVYMILRQRKLGWW